MAAELTSTSALKVPQTRLAFPLLDTLIQFINLDKCQKTSGPREGNEKENKADHGPNLTVSSHDQDRDFGTCL